MLPNELLPQGCQTGQDKEPPTWLYNDCCIRRNATSVQQCSFGGWILCLSPNIPLFISVSIINSVRMKSSMSSPGQSHLLVAATCAATAFAIYAAYDNESRKHSHACQEQSVANDAGDEYEEHLADDPWADTLTADSHPAVTDEDVESEQQTLQQLPHAQQHAMGTTGTEPWWAHDALSLIMGNMHCESARQQWECRFLGMLPAAAAAMATASRASAIKRQNIAVHIEGPAMPQTQPCETRALLQPEPVPAFTQCRQHPAICVKGSKQQQLMPAQARPAAQRQSWPASQHCLQQQVHLQLQPRQQQQQQQQTQHAGAQQLDITTTPGVPSPTIDEANIPTAAHIYRCSSSPHVRVLTKGSAGNSIEGSSAGPGCMLPRLMRAPIGSKCASSSPASMQSLVHAEPGPGQYRLPVCVDQQVQTSPQESPSAGRSLATQIVQQGQQPQSHHSPLATEQHLHELSGSVQQAEQLADALQQQSCRLTAELQQLQQRERAAKALATHLQVRHDDQLKKLMQVQQQLEQQRVLYMSYQGTAVQKLQCLLAQLQTQQTATHQQSTAQAAEADLHAVLLLSRSQSWKGRAHIDTALSASEGSPQDAVVAHTEEQDQQAIDKLINQLELQIVQILQSREAAVAPARDLQLQVEQLTAELQAAEEISNAAAVDRHNTLKAKDELQRKLAGVQRQLVAKSADLAAVTNDRIAIAAAKTQLHHHLQALKEQQLVLETTVQQATDAAESSARRADKLQETVGTAQASLAASEAAKQQVVQMQQQLKSAEYELSLVQSERNNGLQHVAQLQLKLQVSQSESCQHLQQAQQLEKHLQNASNRTAILQQQLKDAHASQHATLQLVEQLQQEAQAAAEQASKLQQQLTQLQTEQEHSAHEVLLLSQHLQQATDDANQAKQLLSQVKQQLQAASQQVQHLQEQLVTAQQQANEAQQTRAAAEAQLCAVQNQTTAIRQQAVDWQHQHDAAYEVQVAMQRDRDAALDEVAALQQQVASLKQQHAAAEACAVELHMKLQQSCDSYQHSQQELAAVREKADLESTQLVEALSAAQARISGSTQQVVEAQRDVTQLAQVVELQQQQLAWQQEQMCRLHDFVRRSPVQLQIPQDLALSIAAASSQSSSGPSAAASPEPQTAAIRPTTATPPPAQHYQPSTADALQHRIPGPVSSHSSSARSVTHRSSADIQMPAKITGPQGVVPGSASTGTRRRTHNQAATTATEASNSQGLPAGLERRATCELLGGARVPVQPVEETGQGLEALRNMVRRVPSRIPSLCDSNNTTSISSSTKKPAVLVRSQSDKYIGAAAPVSSKGCRQGAAAIIHSRSSSSLLQESLAQGLPGKSLKPGLRQASVSSKQGCPAPKLTFDVLASGAVDYCSSDSGSEGDLTAWLWSNQQHRQQQQPSGGDTAAKWPVQNRGQVAGGLVDIKGAGSGSAKSFRRAGGASANIV